MPLPDNRSKQPKTLHHGHTQSQRDTPPCKNDKTTLLKTVIGTLSVYFGNFLKKIKTN